MPITLDELKRRCEAAGATRFRLYKGYVTFRVNGWIVGGYESDLDAVARSLDDVAARPKGCWEP